MVRELPSVSIVILTYNGSRFMRGLLGSLRDQTYPARLMEIIVVDNGSRDNTLSIINNHFPEVKCFALPENQGFAAGNNVGYRHARHPFIVFLNQDTLCHRNWLYGLVIPMLDDQKTAACVSNIIPADPEDAGALDLNGTVDTLFFCDLSPFGYGRYLEKQGRPMIQTLLVSGCSFIVRRSVIEQLGYLFDRRLWMYAEDTDLSLRISGLGMKVYAVRDSIVYHLHGSDFNLSRGGIRKAFGAIQNRLRVYFNNMRPIEFCLYLPLLALGGGGKLLALRMPHSRKAIFFLPFSMFSCIAMIVALWTSLLTVIGEKHVAPQKGNRPGKLIVRLLKQHRS